MSNSNQVQTWRFGRTRALFVTQKLLNRAKNRGAERRSEFFSCVQFNFFGVPQTQLEHTNCKIKSILSGLVTRRLYFLKKKWHETAKIPALQKLTHMNLVFSPKEDRWCKWNSLWFINMDVWIFFSKRGSMVQLDWTGLDWDVKAWTYVIIRSFYLFHENPQGPEVNCSVVALKCTLKSGNIQSVKVHLFVEYSICFV